MKTLNTEAKSGGAEQKPGLISLAVSAVDGTAHFAPGSPLRASPREIFFIPKPDTLAHEREAMNSLRAYALAEQRGFGRAGELNDWLQAEAEVDDLLRTQSESH